MNQVCFICNNQIGITQRTATNIFTESTNLGTTLVSLLSDIIGKTIPEDSHSNVICKKCYKTCIDYDSMNVELQQIKKDILAQFRNTLLQHNLNYQTYSHIPVPEKSPAKVADNVTEKKVKAKSIVLSASKLQPLPPDYVINVGKFGLPKVKIATTSASTINLKVTVGSSVLTQSIKAVGTNKLLRLPTNQNSPTKLIDDETSTSITNAISSILNKKAMSSVMSFNVNSLPKDFLSSAVFTKLSEVGEASMKKEEAQEIENNDEQPMEIDEDCTLVRVTNDDNNLLSDDDDDGEKDTSDDSKSQYYDVSLLPLGDGATSDHAQGQSGSQFVLGKLQILKQDGDEDEQTIVMSDENGSILRVMSGQRLVYEGGELSLVPEDRSDGGEEDNDTRDSNEESQIELQVSGDEETANAIIAAAQEQGGAFIKVESGEMFRVKSVQSKCEVAEERKESGDLLQIVVQEDGLFRCLLCSKGEKDSLSAAEDSTGDAVAMMQHLKSEHDARIYICQFCSKVMRKRSEFTAHLEGHANDSNLSPDKSKAHECNVCNKKYSSRSLLSEHMNMHNGTRPYVCSVCHKAFASKYTHQAHVKTHLERPRPFKCKECPKSFLTQQNLNQHEKTHSGIKDFVCNICNKAFGTQHNLEVHGVVHSGNKPFVCGVCGKAFARRAEVRDHMRIHTGERPFACDICGATFSQRSNLHSHKRATHMDDKRYHCQQCPKRFKRRRLLDYHMKASHTGERPLQCEVCRATFVYPEHYKKHVRIHSGEKPYVCEVCGKSFNSRDNRNTHRFVHSDKKPYECLVCGAGYMRKQLLLAHMNTSGHITESIVVNQPRVQKVTENIVTTDSIVMDAIKMKTDKLDTIFEPAVELELDPSSSSAVSLENDAAAKLFITGDKKFYLQDGKSTINLVQDGDDPTMVTLQNVEGIGKSEAEIIQSINAEQIDHQGQMLASDENGGVVRLVQIHLNNGSSGWMAINQ